MHRTGASAQTANKLRIWPFTLLCLIVAFTVQINQPLVARWRDAILPTWLRLKLKLNKPLPVDWT